MSDYHIEVTVTTEFLPQHSNPSDDQFAFSYVITLTNKGARAAKLLRRHWIITDGHGIKKEIYGTGVVGEQPYLQPGENYTYRSGVMLKTPLGSMQGIYLMQADDGARFDAVIAPFSLAMSEWVH